jgi:hypothetical protein
MLSFPVIVALNTSHLLLPPLCVLCASAFSPPLSFDSKPGIASNPQSPNVDAVDVASSLSPFPAALTKNTRGWVYPPRAPRARTRPSALTVFTCFPRTVSPFDFERSTVNWFFPKSFRIRTSAKSTRNPCGMNTSRTKDLKSFRMNTYKKRGRGEGANPQGIRNAEPPDRSGIFYLR